MRFDLLLLFLLSANVSAQSFVGFFLDTGKNVRRPFFPFFSTPLEENLFAQTDTPIMKTKVIIDFQTEDIYRESREDGTETSIQSNRREFNVDIPVSSDQFLSTIGIRMFSSSLSASGDFRDFTLRGFQSRRDGIGIDYTMSVNTSIQIGLSIGYLGDRTQSAYEYESAALYRFSDRSAFQLRIERRATLDFAQVAVSRIDGFLPLDFVEQGGAIGLMFPVGNLIIHAGAHQGTVSPLPYSLREQNLHFLPVGTYHTLKSMASLPISEDGSVFVSAYHTTVDISGKFLAAGSSYGNIHSFIYREQAYAAGVQERISRYVTAEADLRWKETVGTLTGHVESWPFVSIFQSPVIQRGDIIFDGSLRFWKFHTGGSFFLYDGLSTHVGLDLLRAIPRMKIETWGYRFLVLGVNNYQQTRLDIDWIDAALVSFNIVGSFLSAQVSYSATQFIPLHLKRSREAREIGEPSGASPTSPSGNSRGGLLQRITVAYQF